MEAPITLFVSSFPNHSSYIDSAEDLVANTLLTELARFSLTKDDLQSRNTAAKYQIGVHVSTEIDSIHKIYSAFGWTLVEAFYTADKVVVSTPRALINYSESKRYIKEQLDLDLQSFRYKDNFSDDLDPTAQ